MDMQTFRKWLSSTPGSSQAYRRQLVLLNRASLTQVLNLRSEITWVFWNAAHAANAQS